MDHENETRVTSRRQQLDDTKIKSDEECEGQNDDNSKLTAKFFDDDSTNYNHQCYICDKTFSANSNLNRHLRKIHKENVQSPYNNVKCALCESLYSSSHIYNHHLETDHKVKIEIENLNFPTKDSFVEWKLQVESETTSQFIKSRGEKKTKNVNKTYYSCNRSGYYVSKARTRKALKKQGSRKINGRCPASMNVTVNPDSSYHVRFVKTHVGHDFELKHLDLSDRDRDLIVQKLASGLTKKDLIKQIRYVAEQNQQPCNASISPASNHSTGAISLPIIISNRNSLINNDQVDSVQPTNEHMIAPANHSASSSTSSTPIPAASSTANGVNASQNIPLPISRLYLATTKDLHNILNSKHLDPKKIRHNYDLNNVEAWMNEMKEFDETSGVLFYKEQNEKSEKFPKLRQDDFIFILMNHGQSQILRQLGDKCIIIDSTHQVHCEYLHVSVVSVVDEERRGFPVAFMFSTRTDVDVLEVFFSTLKEKVGIITTRMFIADELHDFYQAWWKVMSMPIHNLLSPWSVFEAWSKKFDTVGSKEKLRKLKRHLRSLLTETEADKFTKLLGQVLNDYKSDQDVCKFIEYFETNYSRNPDIWSSCLRKNYNVSNYQLLSLHEKFKSVYKEGKNSKKLCKYIANLMNLYEEYQLERLAQFEEAGENKQQALIKRHKKSVESGSLVYEVAVEPAYWLCPSESSSEVYYEVKHSNDGLQVRGKKRKKRNESIGAESPEREHQDQQVQEQERDKEIERNIETKKCCDLQCPSCATCRHEYQCTCLDYVVNLNMCKHIHRICTMCR